MVDSLRDQLLKSGLVKPDYRERVAKQPVAPKPTASGGRRTRKSPAPQAAAGKDDIGLAKAYALRAEQQARERRQREQALAEEARLRRERKARMQELLAGSALNKSGADHPRHFEYAGKIRRIYVDAEQLRALNLGELGIVQHDGRYLLVSSGVARQVQALDARHLALLVDPAALAVDDGVPDDLTW
ncbi:MAG TPA: DUF2058 family protein [Rhodanobacter sp.]|jgi:uncharacterized protein YaiL (DUF2058 family)|nr:DUF2058 family protein [Rhodanobacter sp.]